MSLALRKSRFFEEDVLGQFVWYLYEANEEVAWRFQANVDQTLVEISKQPGIGRERAFVHPLLRGLRSYRVKAPFDKFLIFYRYDERFLDAWRLMHGARDLPRRLPESPEGSS